MAMKVAINGLGRIGRVVLRIYLQKEPQFEVVAINDIAPLDQLAYLLKYDSVHLRWPQEVTHREDKLIVGPHSFRCFAESDPARLPWKELGVDLVLECSGACRGRDEAGRHLLAGASYVVISAPSDNVDQTVVLGINEDTLDLERHKVISMASCTTNCLAPVAKVLDKSFGIKYLWATTVHAYTSSQSLIDKPTRKRARGRAATLSIVPTSTGAADAIGRVLPELQDKIKAAALRVPIPDGSATDIIALVNRDVTIEEVNQALRQASESERMRGILGYTEEDLVSADIIGDPRSSLVSAISTEVLAGRMVRVLSWYDNEWGYSARLIDFAELIATRRRQPVAV